MNKNERILMNYLKKDIYTAISMCVLLDKQDKLLELSVLLAKTEYFGYWDLVEELNIVAQKIL